MAFNTEHISDLLYRYCAQEAMSVAERTELQQWLEADPVHREMLDRLQHKQLLQEDLQRLVGFKRETESAWEDFSARIRPAGKVRLMRSPKRWVGWAAAVAVLLVGAGAYYMVQHVREKKVIAAVTHNDIAPGSNKAVLTLADGSTVTLDSAGRQVIQQGATAIKQQGGTLQYDAVAGTGDGDGAGSKAVAYNILTTPRGGQFQVTLPDGTQVWLNAESSLRYPTAFSGKERLVEITGEGYFEIAKNAQQPFKVQVGRRTTIEVLGTAFNVNAYTNEKSLNTTLVQGKIKVGEVILIPGQQAQLSDKMKVVSGADIDKVLAWKNGFFNFENASLEEVMRQLSRWYDIEVVYEKGIPDIYFAGDMSRDMNLAGLLKALETTKVHFRIEGRRLIVMP